MMLNQYLKWIQVPVEVWVLSEMLIAISVKLKELQVLLFNSHEQIPNLIL